jgi:hypothetical protein
MNKFTLFLFYFCNHKSCKIYYRVFFCKTLAKCRMFIFSFHRSLFTEVQLINPSRAALVPVLPLSPENSQNNISNAPHPADIHPAYRIPYMQLLHTLHSATSPQSSLHANFSSENLPHPGALGVPYSLNNFSNNDINMERIKTDRSNGLSQSSAMRADPVANFNRKRALSSSPYPDLLDVSSMIRYSPSSLYGSKNSNASGSFGHLGATALNATTASATNASIGTPMSISSLPTSLQHFLISGELLPSLSGHYISPTNSMFSLAHHQAMASSLMQIDASMQSLKNVSLIFFFLINSQQNSFSFILNRNRLINSKSSIHQIQRTQQKKLKAIQRL